MSLNAIDHFDKMMLTYRAHPPRFADASSGLRCAMIGQIFYNILVNPFELLLMKTHCVIPFAPLLSQKVFPSAPAGAWN